jgi:hypothetical protein
MKKLLLFITSLLLVSLTNGQNRQEIDWWKSQKIFIGGSLGFGWSNQIDLHMSHTFSINGLPDLEPDPTMMNSGLFTFSGALSYYPSKYFSVHLKGSRQSHSIDDITGQDGKSYMNAAVFQAKINIIHKEKELGTINNIYVGGGIGTYSFHFWRKSEDIKTDVLYNTAIGPNIVIGTEYMFLNDDRSKTNFVFYFDLTCDIAGFDFKSATETNGNSTINGQPFTDWEHINGNSISIDLGLRFSLFNKKLPVVFK